MYRYVISSLIAIAMVATVFLWWPPEAKGSEMLPVCCEVQLDMADCFCVSKFGGDMRQVECKSSPECVEDGCLLECNIGPTHCRWYETGKVLQKFMPFTLAPQLVLCSACTNCGSCTYDPCGPP